MPRALAAHQRLIPPAPRQSTDVAHGCRLQVLARLVLTAAAWLCCGVGSISAETLRFSGFVAAAYDVEDHIGPEAEFQLELRTKRVKGMRIETQLDARYFRDRMILEDAFIDYAGSDRVTLQLGVNKKRLGLEYEQSRRERLTPKRSYVYQKLEALGIVGRQLNLRALTEPSNSLFVDLTLGTDGSRDVNALLSVRRERGHAGVGTWLLVERHRIDKGALPVWAQALSAWYISDRLRLVAELLGGLDSTETDLEKTFGGGRRVWFVGPKLEAARAFAFGEHGAFEFMVQSSVVAHDIDELAYNTVQVLGGVNTHYRGAVLAVTAEYLGETERRPSHTRAIAWPNFYAEAIYHF